MARALERPTWRPDIRAAVISRTHINLHRKIVKHVAFTGPYPISILSDCVVYAAHGPSPLEVREAPELNLARSIKDGTVSTADNGE
ncbi:transcriptional regulator [Streptomyces griseus]|nr:transcriptional regulator [Streptomyces griseus]